MNIKAFITLILSCLLLLGNPAFAKDAMQGKVELHVKSLKLIKDNWGDLGDGEAELRLIVITETDNKADLQAQLTIPPKKTIKAVLGQSVDLGDYSLGVGIPVENTTMRFYVVAIDDDEQDFKASLAESGVIKFIARQIDKDAAKLFYKTKNANLLSYLLAQATEEGAYAVKDYLEKHDKIGSAVIEVNGNKGWNQDTTITSEENSVEFAYETKFTPSDEASRVDDDTPRSSSRESSSRTSGQYRINGDGTVTDTKTGLMWKRCSEGQSGDSCSGEADEYKWDDAMSKFGSDVSFAGYSDWRMPTKEELRSLVYCSNGTPQEVAWDHFCDNNGKAGQYQKPTINQTAFPNTPKLPFWSFPVAGSYAWGVGFGNGLGYDGGDVKNEAFQVRLVRSGQ